MVERFFHSCYLPSNADPYRGKSAADLKKCLDGCDGTFPIHADSGLPAPRSHPLCVGLT